MPCLPTSRTRLVTVLLGILSPIVVLACTSPDDGGGKDRPPKNWAVCGKTKPGPQTAPPGAVTVDPARDGDLIDKTRKHPPGTTFWLAPGSHTLGKTQFGQVQPKNGNRYIGAPGAVLDGRERNRYAFVFDASDVMVAHLTIRGFIPPVNEGVVNHDSGDGWVIAHNTIEHNRGAGMMAGARQRIVGNCLRDNGQYALNAAKPGDSITDLVVEGNEITGNNADDTERQHPGCGCSGAMKFWAVNGADVRHNWIHHNRGSGVWADTNNNDFLIEHNLIEDNDGSAILYETSYNAVIRDNNIRRNNWVDGREFLDRGDNFPVATIYLSEAGGQPRIPARTDKIEIYRNTLTDNWSGITLWENADRFCNSPSNTSTGYCTLLVPDVKRCAPPAIARKPLLSDCRWKTQRVDIHHNRFAIDPGKVRCKAICARMAVLSNYGTVPEWSPYREDLVQQSITLGQENTWHDNTYVGPWTFMPHDTGRMVGADGWQSRPYQQDRGSTFERTSG